MTDDKLLLLKTSGIGRWPGKKAASYRLDGLAHRSEWEQPFCRASLRTFCMESSNDVEHCVVAILAWGGAKAEHAREFWKKNRDWRHAIVAIRSEQLSRKDAYDLFACLRKDGKMPGVGPAYFTKLLWFMRPIQDAYIMDQWTARSMHILMRGAAPKIDLGYRVSDRNTGAEYEAFCKGLESIAEQIDETPENCEAMMFSQGGRSALPWRNYVKNYNGQT